MSSGHISSYAKPAAKCPPASLAPASLARTRLLAHQLQEGVMALLSSIMNRRLPKIVGLDASAALKQQSSHRDAAGASRAVEGLHAAVWVAHVWVCACRKQCAHGLHIFLFGRILESHDLLQRRLVRDLRGQASGRQGGSKREARVWAWGAGM